MNRIPKSEVEEDSWIDALVYLAKASKKILKCNCAEALTDVFENMHDQFIQPKIAQIRPEEIEDQPPSGCSEIEFRKAIWDSGFAAGLLEGAACALKWHLRVPDDEDA